jgi:hypothetical protein
MACCARNCRARRQSIPRRLWARRAVPRRTATPGLERREPRSLPPADGAPVRPKRWKISQPGAAALG